MEIVYLTAYTAGQITGTITRAAEDSTHWPAVAHNLAAGPPATGLWVQAPTVQDFVAVGSGISALTGDVTASGSGSVAATVAGLNGTPLGVLSGVTTGELLEWNGTDGFPGSGGSGTVTTVSVASANGFTGTVANATSTPAITVATSITGVLKGNGTAIQAATADAVTCPTTPPTNKTITSPVMDTIIVAGERFNSPGSTTPSWAPPPLSRCPTRPSTAPTSGPPSTEHHRHTAVANLLNSATTTVNVSAATAPTNGQVLTATSGTTATWQTLSGGGNMNTSTYDPAAIAQQLVGTTASQTLTNKTLTAPVIGTIVNTGTLTLPTSTGHSGRSSDYGHADQQDTDQPDAHYTCTGHTSQRCSD